MIFCIDLAAQDIMMVYLMWRRRSWIKNTDQLLQRATPNAFAGGSLMFYSGDCISFAGINLVPGAVEVVTMHAFLY